MTILISSLYSVPEVVFIHIRVNTNTYLPSFMPKFTAYYGYPSVFSTEQYVFEIPLYQHTRSVLILCTAAQYSTLCLLQNTFGQWPIDEYLGFVPLFSYFIPCYSAKHTHSSFYLINLLPNHVCFLAGFLPVFTSNIGLSWGFIFL